MNLDQASAFLSGSILFALAVVALAIGVLAINNLFNKYWKPTTIFSKDSFTLFTGHGPDMLTDITDSEYQELREHLEKIRNQRSNKGTK
jgi:hypothetical protein